MGISHLTHFQETLALVNLTRVVPDKGPFVHRTCRKSVGCRQLCLPSAGVGNSPTLSQLPRPEVRSSNYPRRLPRRRQKKAKRPALVPPQSRAVNQVHCCASPPMWSRPCLEQGSRLCHRGPSHLQQIGPISSNHILFLQDLNQEIQRLRDLDLE